MRALRARSTRGYEKTMHFTGRLHLWLLAAIVTAGITSGSVAIAQDTVECRSRDHQYDECWAGPLRQPQLIHQISSAACILNNSWGYNPSSQYIWVANGCAGVFADVGGYHHGRGDTYDEGARRHDDRGRDIGPVIAGAVVGALIEGMASSGHSNHHDHHSDHHGHHASSNHSEHHGHN